MRKFFEKQENLLANRNFFVPSIRIIFLDSREQSRNKINFLGTRSVFLLKEICSSTEFKFPFRTEKSFFSVRLIFLF